MTFNVTFTCSVSLVNLEARWKIYPFPVINAGIDCQEYSHQNASNAA